MDASHLRAALSDRYTLEREIGAGGMATVYLARDIRHGRDVAIKILHPDLGAALGADRFLGEISTTAKLQHPHILPLLDSGSADGMLFYVMPLVDGETLRARLERERQLPIEDAVRIAGEIAGALDYAHRHGVIHRDIKPENILLHDGRAVVADFGIALAVSAASGPRMTQTGLSLGTPQYMSPEQAMGERQIDARADVYALGAVVYEMLTGEPPFSGATVQAIVAKVLTERPMNPSAVRDTIPRHVEGAVLKALAKLPADRYANAAQFAEALVRPELSASYGGSTRQGDQRGGRAFTRYLMGSSVMPVATVAFVTTAAIAAWGWLRTPAQPAPPPIIKVNMAPLGGVTVGGIGPGNLLALSRDGSLLAMIGIDSIRIPRLFVRSLSSMTIAPVPATPFVTVFGFSPRGDSIVFGSASQISVTAVAGGEPRVVARIGARSLAWNDDNTILCTMTNAVLQLALATGKVDTLLVAKPGTSYASASFVRRDAIVVQFADGATTGGIGVMSLHDHQLTPLGITGGRPTLVGDNMLAYLRADGRLMAIGFDPRSLSTHGAPQVIADGVLESIRTGANVAIARNGTAVYVAGGAPDTRDLLLVDRLGTAHTIGGEQRAYRYPRFSPDGRRLSVGVEEAGPAVADVWVLDLAASRWTRMTTDSSSIQASWTPDGNGLVFMRHPLGATTYSLIRIASDGSGQRSTVMTRPVGVWENLMTPDEKTLVWREDALVTGRDIYMAPLNNPAAMTPLVATPFDEKGITLSPDGHWLAYVSNETGVNEIYIRRLEPSSPRWTVSVKGGDEPRWAKSGELFFRVDDSVMVSRIELGPVPRIGAPVKLFSGKFAASSFEALYDVSPDGKQFAMVRGPQVDRQVVLVMNWAAHFR